MKKRIEEMRKDLIEIFDEEYEKRRMITPDFTAEKMTAIGYRKQEWISVEDRLPDKELNEFRNGNENLLYPCLVFIKHSFLSKGYINKAWYMGSKFVEQNTDDITEVVTHWMPLPEPPEMKGE